MNTRTVFLNGESILYSAPVTGKARMCPMHPHVCRGTVSMTQSQPTLPSNRAFVVQFRAQSSGALLSWAGRVEHLVSHQGARFQSLAELLEFMTRVLTEVEAQPGAQ